MYTIKSFKISSKRLETLNGKDKKLEQGGFYLFMHWSFITYLYLEYILGNNQQSYLSDSEKRALQQKIDDKNKEIEKLKEDANRNIQCDIGASERLVRWNEISYLVDKKIVEMHKINYIIAIMKIFFRVKWRGGHPNANEDCKRKRRKTQRIEEYKTHKIIRNMILITAFIEIWKI